MKLDLPECSIQRRHFLTELSYKQEGAECYDLYDKIIITSWLLFIVAMFIVM